MFELHAQSIESDLHESGLLDAYGDFANGLRFKFDDRKQGFFYNVGGSLGNGSVGVARFNCTQVSFRIPDANHITYEKNLMGSAFLVHDDGQLQTGNGYAAVTRQGDFEHNFLPAHQVMNGISTILMLDTVDRYLAAAGERRVDEVENVVIDNSGAGGPDQVISELTNHVLDNFDFYIGATAGKRAQLMEALLVEVFVQFLQDIGSLKLGKASHDATSCMVARAKEYIQANFRAPITVADIAAATGVSLRSLQVGFKNLGMTPRQYLTSVRLEHVHEMLKSGLFSDVTSVALQCGITHLGRFSQIYRERFGELPSETLR
ncbi:MAG: hypothetical protein DHS20C01_36290 [marine bacterium B5-7]|nr:MAG: hypothetical protein DHS20C01_36290 [marine bacterium B5-7]